MCPSNATMKMPTILLPALHGITGCRFLKVALLFLAAWILPAVMLSADEKPTPVGGLVDAGVGKVDITPTEPVTLAGSPSPKGASEVKTRLYVRALVLSGNGTKVAVVTLDTLKYPVNLVQLARAKVEETTGIPASNVIICASHTHSGPLWSYYKDKLITSIADAVALAARDLTPCTVGTAKGRAEGVSECRRVIKDGHAWNRWQLKPDEADKYPAEGPSDPEFDVLAFKAADGKFKGVVYNFACHAANTRIPVISADYPGEVEAHVQKELGYEVPTLFLTGACGDINPIYSVRRDLIAQRLGGEIVRCLGELAPVLKPVLSIECREFQMPGREQPKLQEEEIARNWPTQLDHYKKTFADMKQKEKPAYQYFITGIRVGDDFAIVTNANELFCSIGLSIKSRSPFKQTMVAEQTTARTATCPPRRPLKAAATRPGSASTPISRPRPARSSNASRSMS